jgi:hypothetical protein
MIMQFEGSKYFLWGTYLLGVVIVTYFVYRLGLPGSFLLDDFHVLEGIGLNGGVSDLASVFRYVFGSDGGSWSRSFSHLSFLIDDQFWPSFPLLFKATNIALHLITGLLTALILLILLRRRFSEYVSVWIAVIAASIWLVHPLHVSTTLYVVQRMTQLSTIFVLLALIFHCCAMQARSILSFLVWVALAVLSGLLGVLSKESALSGIWLIGLVNVFFFGESLEAGCQNNITLRRWYRRLIIVSAVSLIFVFIYYSLFNTAFGFRVFDRSERLGIEGVILAKYWQYWLWPWGADVGLFHDDFEHWVSTEGVGLKPFWWILHVVLIFAACVWRKKIPLVAFGILFFYISHVIESTIWPLELMYEHRNYLPTVGLSLVMASLAYYLVEACRNKELAVLGLSIIALYLGSLLIQLTYRTALWADYRILVSKWAYEHPDSLRSQTSFVTMLANAGMVDMAADKLEATYQKLPSLSVRLHQINLQCLHTVSDQNAVRLSREEVSASKFDSGVLHQLQLVVRHKNIDCVEGYFIDFDFPWLLESIGNMPDLQNHSRYRASFNDLIGSYYIQQRQFSPAVKAWLSMYEIQPTADTAMRVSELFLLGGNVEQAQIYLDYAKQKNTERWYRDVRRDQQIQHLQNGIDILLLHAVEID